MKSYLLGSPKDTSMVGCSPQKKVYLQSSVCSDDTSSKLALAVSTMVNDGYLSSKTSRLTNSDIPDIPASGPEVISPASLPENSLPEKYTRLVNGNFLVLDHHIKSSSSSVPGPEEEETSYIDIAFGDDRKGFAGFHRFEIFREPKEDEVTICYSSMSCDPSANKMPFPNFIFLFHIFYAERLFWDGIRGVLSN
jgi:hypothetical protein